MPGDVAEPAGEVLLGEHPDLAGAVRADVSSSDADHDDRGPVPTALGVGPVAVRLVNRAAIDAGALCLDDDREPARAEDVIEIPAAALGDAMGELEAVGDVALEQLADTALGLGAELVALGLVEAAPRTEGADGRDEEAGQGGVGIGGAEPAKGDDDGEGTEGDRSDGVLGAPEVE